MLNLLIHTFAPPFLLTGRGEPRVFESILEVHFALRGLRVGDAPYHVRNFHNLYVDYRAPSISWRVIDLYGVIVPTELVRCPGVKRPYRNSRAATVRGIPVYRTGRRGGYGSWMRFPTHAAARREEVTADECRLEEGIRIKAAHRPPSSWDDIPRHCERNWKRQRTTQWGGR